MIYDKAVNSPSILRAVLAATAEGQWQGASLAQSAGLGASNEDDLKKEARAEGETPAGRNGAKDTATSPTIAWQNRMTLSLLADDRVTPREGTKAQWPE